MKEKTFNIIIVCVFVMAVGGLIFAGYSFKQCPEPLRNTTPQWVPHIDTLYKVKITDKIIKHYEKNPYRPVAACDSVSIFDSLAKYYGY